MVNTLSGLLPKEAQEGAFAQTGRSVMGLGLIEFWM